MLNLFVLLGSYLVLLSSS
jgi:hypothetical protein